MTGNPENVPPTTPGAPAWQTCLGPNPVEPADYFQGINRPLAEILRRPPRRALELGCAAGRLGAFVREKFPGVHYTGIEANAAAAAIARTRLDRVIEAKLEALDFASEGIGAGSIDTFIAGDVLEHLYDPWRALLHVRPVLAGDAQVAISLPNVRNLFVQSQLHNEGTWRYATHGLLDITHIRFFALRDAVRLVHETGFDVDDVRCNLDPRFAAIYEENRNGADIAIQVGRMKLENLSPRDLQEYCTLQFVVLAHPRPGALTDPPAG
jgi:SAM-dependent methyltransferase